MNKRIFHYMSLLISLTILVFGLLWSIAYFFQFSTQVKNSLETLRVSIIDETGRVTFDNMADPTALENHLDRPEVAEALQNGRGKSERFSSTLGETTHFYAVRMADGSILRLALEMDSLAAMLLRFIPFVVMCLLVAACVSFIFARRLTWRIIAPINRIDLDAPEFGDYDELLPLIKRIKMQKRELASQLTEMERRAATIAAITENMKEGLLLLDENGKVLLTNESALDILNVPAAVSRNIIEVCRNADFLAQVKHCLMGEKAELVLYLRERYYSVYLSPVWDKQRISGAAVLFIDSTERYAAEAQRKEFSANVSHELKTPLTTIAALSEMLADGTAKEQDVQPFAGKIKAQTGRLIEIIDDIIRLSEFDENVMPKAFTTFNLYDLTETVIAALRDAAAERLVTVTLFGEPHMQITANMRMMDELLYNLIDNAIKYNHEGGRVAVTLAQEVGRIRIIVEDTGIGIAQEDLTRIFERFYRVDKSRSKKTGGTGLGLSIVKHIAEFHSGSVSAQSTVGEGAAFTVIV